MNCYPLESYQITLRQNVEGQANLFQLQTTQPPKFDCTFSNFVTCQIIEDSGTAICTVDSFPPPSITPEEINALAGFSMEFAFYFAAILILSIFFMALPSR